ncbi:MAG: DNA-binding protein [Ignavibacteria bacterium]
MKRSLYVLLVLAVFSFSACRKNGHKPGNAPAMTGTVHTAKVIDKMNATNYTYMLVNENSSYYWIAVPQLVIEEGETISFSRAMEMKNFKSETLKRTFESILFVEDCVRGGQEGNGQATTGGAMPAHPQVKSVPEQVAVESAKGGKTVAQIFKEKAALNGKIVKVRGKVTKYNPGIMDRNWIHIQDGTNDAGNYDLMVTSKESTNVGEVITVEGKVAVDIDFGAGYSYPVMIENTKITKE